MEKIENKIEDNKGNGKNLEDADTTRNMTIAIVTAILSIVIVALTQYLVGAQL